MSGPIHLYVSSSSDLSPEREAIGRIVAALPVTIGWQISHTPLAGSPAAGAPAMLGLAELEIRIRDCDLYALVLGQDLTAPMGFEVRSALSSARLLGAYRKACSRSPSAQDAVRTLDVEWQRYADPAAFAARFRRDLLRALLDVGPSLGLDLADVERLLKDTQAEGTQAEEMEEPAGQGHAGRSGRILGREVWQAGAQD